MKLFLALLFLIGMGASWMLGRQSYQKEKQPQKKDTFPQHYLTGLNFLLNEETDKAVDFFIKILEVDSETVETHLAVAKLFRRRGEVDRAIRIHQNLIARPQLDKIYREQSLFELGQDYLSAGMLDRAERIFRELVKVKSYSSQALKALIDIFQQEKDWKNAIEFTLKYEGVTAQNMSLNIAHYYCELGEIALSKKQHTLAQDHLHRAIGADALCARSSLLLAKLHIEENDYRAALTYLKKVKDQNPDYLSEAVDLLICCYEKLGQEEELISYVNELSKEHPHIPAILLLAERLHKKKNSLASHFIADYVCRYPTWRGVYLFINQYLSTENNPHQEKLNILQHIMRKLLRAKPQYRCISCGFYGQVLHWHCPGCKQWSSIKPVHGLIEATKF